MNIETSKQICSAYIDGCHIKNYVYDLRQVQDRSETSTTTLSFRATFSRPTKTEPINTAVAYVTYYLKGTPDQPTISYRIENDSHIHHPEENLAFSEVWLDRVVSRKLKLSKLMNCKTAFDSSRISEKKKEPVIVQKKEVIKERFTTGEVVKAKCNGWSKYYSGTITKVNADGSCSITFEDGETKTQVKDKLILKQGENEPVLIFVAGQQVRAKFAGKGHFYPATISTVNEDGTFDLKYLDGDWEEGAKKENLLPL